ncbi:MAG: T9SS type A sorting domain-containing protein [Bacteroidetes bacterium]|nr:T9SS type A sorting domain-containing protein [Bacteroidota bacterium]
MGDNMDALSHDTDQDGNVYVLGEFSQTADFDPSADTVNQTCVIAKDVFLAKYDSLGDYIWAFQIGDIESEEAAALVVDNNGDVIISGRFDGVVDFDPSVGTFELNSNTGQDPFIAKYDPNGNFMWALNYGNNSDAGISDIEINSLNEIIAIGNFGGGALDFDPSSASYVMNSTGGPDTYCINFSENGNFNWGIQLGGTGTTATCYGYAICMDPTDNIVITGRFHHIVDFDPGPGLFQLDSPAPTYGDVFLVKLTQNGSFLWARSFGSTGPEQGNAIVTDTSGDIYVTGIFQGTVDFDPSGLVLTKSAVGGYDIFTSKFSSTGNLMWNFTCGNATGDAANAISLDGNGKLYIGGLFADDINFDPSNGKAFLSAYTSSTGDFNWSVQTLSYIETVSLALLNNDVGAYGNFYDSAFFDPPSAGLLVPGVGSQNLFISRYDTLGNYEFAKLLGNYSDEVGANESISGVAFKSNDNMVIAGDFFMDLVPDPEDLLGIVSSNGDKDIFLAELTSSNSVVWYKTIGALASDDVSGIFVDNLDNIYISGRFNDSLDFDSTGVTPVFYSAGSQDAFIAKFDPAGNFLWSKIISGPGDHSIGIDLSSDNFIYASGIFTNIADFDPGPGTYNLDGGSKSMYYAKYSIDGDLIWAEKIGLTSNLNVSAPIMKNDSVIMMTGWFFGTVDFDPGPGTGNLSSVSGYTDVFVVQYDTSGQFLSAFRFGGSQSDIGSDLLSDNAGNIYVTGLFATTCNFSPSGPPVNVTSVGGNDIFFARFNSTNQLDFVKATGSPGYDTGFDLIMDNDLNIWQTGFFSETIDFDPGSGINNLTSKGYFDIFVRKFDTLGNHIWTKSIGGKGIDQPSMLNQNNAGDFFLAGEFSYLTDVDPSTNVEILASLNMTDCYLLGLTPCSISSSMLDTVSCSAILYNDQVLSASGVYQQLLTNAEGCDSIVTIDFTLLASYSSIDTVACSFYLSPGGNFLNTDGIFIDTISNYLGCDSIITITLDILQSFSTLNLSGCDSVISPSGNYTWNIDGTYIDTLLNTMACDSIMTVNVSIQKSYDTVFVAACEQYTSPSGNYTWNTGGTYSDTLSNFQSCDSIISINLSILNPSYNTIDIQNCEGILSPSGNYYWTSSGTYMDTIVNNAGCDSILTINLTVVDFDNSVTQNFDVLTANQAGGTYQWLDCNLGMTPIAGATNQVFTANQDGSYAVTVIYDGCTFTSPCSQVLGLSTGVNEGISILIYPNPSNNGGFTISGLPGEITNEDIEITGSLGQLIPFEVEFENNCAQVRLSFSPGLYIIKIFLDNKVYYLNLILS